MVANEVGVGWRLLSFFPLQTHFRWYLFSLEDTEAIFFPLKSCRTDVSMINNAVPDHQVFILVDQNPLKS